MLHIKLRGRQKQLYSAVCIILLCGFTGLLCGYAKANSADLAKGGVTARVHHVIDGDSLVLATESKTVEVRLWGIDAPEYDQPGAEEAAAYLCRLADRKTVLLEAKYRDRYGRTVGIIEFGSVTVNEAMVASGNAWVHTYYCNEPVCSKWKKLEKKAKKQRLGFWNMKDPVEPWVWKTRR